MLLDSISSKLRASGNWKWNYPSPSTPSPFPSAYADVHYQTWYRRVPAAHFVSQSVAFDAWEKGFHIKQLDDDKATEVYNAFDDVFIPGLPNAHALSRLFGHSCLLLGFNDVPKAQWNEEVQWDKAKLKWTLPVGKPDMIVTDWVGIPEEPKTLGVSCYPDLPTDIHSSRFFYLENPDITDRDFHECLPFAVYPGGPTKPADWERLRPLYRRFIPLLDRLDRAGWQPVPCAQVQPEALFVERFGPEQSGTFLLVAHNRSDEAVEGRLDLLPQELARRVDQWTGSASVKELLSERELPVSPDEGTLHVALALGSKESAVLEVTPVSPASNVRPPRMR